MFVTPTDALGLRRNLQGLMQDEYFSEVRQNHSSFGGLKPMVDWKTTYSLVRCPSVVWRSARQLRKAPERILTNLKSTSLVR